MNDITGRILCEREDKIINEVVKSRSDKNLRVSLGVLRDIAYAVGKHVLPSRRQTTEEQGLAKLESLLTAAKSSDITDEYWELLVLSYAAIYEMIGVMDSNGNK